MIVGTSTNCSAVCGTERTVRGQREGVGSGTKESRAVKNDNSWSTICGTGTSRVGDPDTASTIWSTVCRWTRSYLRQGCRPPWVRGASGTWPCSASDASPPALAVFWRCALWCVDSARAIATAIRLYRKCERRRRSLRRRALPVPPPASSRSAMASQPLMFEQKGIPKATQSCSNLRGSGGGGAEWWCGRGAVRDCLSIRAHACNG